MKSNKLFFGALTLLAFTACSDDKNNEPIQSGDSQDMYIKVNIMAANPGGRSGETFEQGSENEISNITLIFYGASGNYLTHATLTKDDEIKAGTLDQTPNVECVKTVEAKVSISNNVFPSYMMAFINPVEPSNLNWGLGSINDQKRTTWLGANNKYAMNNSVYYNKNNEFCQAVSVTKDNFYQTEAEKKDANEVEVYVERIAAKVTLQGKDASETSLGNQSGTIGENSLVFTVTGWGLNATAKQTYLCKNIGSSYSTVNGQINNSFDWNDSDRNRSYWAFTPFYTKPTDAENIKDNIYKFPFVSSQVSSGNTLTYNKFSSFTTEPGTSMYTLENTVNSAFYNSNPYRNSSLISAIVAGYYTVNGKREDFYVQGTDMYLTADFIRAMAKQGAVIVKSDGTPLSKDMTNEQLAELFEIYHPTEPIFGDITRGVEENKVTIKFKDTETNRTNYKFKLGSAEAVAITDENIDDIQETLYSNCGLSSAYTQGYAYFNVPIRHLASEPAQGGGWKPGSFGVVRNHHYIITVEKFAPLSTATLGKGVLNPENPVVPPTDPDEDYGIKAKIRVLSWRLVKQSVTLGEK